MVLSVAVVINCPRTVRYCWQNQCVGLIASLEFVQIPCSRYISFDRTLSRSNGNFSTSPSSRRELESVIRAYDAVSLCAALSVR